MTAISFIKMHGIGNDYVFIDGFTSSLSCQPEELARIVSNRHTGIGSDGLVYIEPPSNATSESAADAVMRMWNADGSEGMMCGNALRCIAFWLHREGRCGNGCRIQTGDRIVQARVIELAENQNSAVVQVNMGPARIRGSVIESLPDVCLPNGSPLQYTDVFVGNPHAVVFVDRLSDELVQDIGPKVECHLRFPDRTNVEFVRQVNDGEFEVRVWERGSGETLACGSGACAVAAAATARGLAERDQAISVSMSGGVLTLTQNPNGELIMEGPTELSFRGKISITIG